MTYQIPLTMGLIVDNFAGGGGASTGIESALKRPVNIAINHDPDALGMHEVNHPLTEHYCEDVWTVDPRKVCKGRPVDLAWFSPDCKHFSKAKGGALRDKKIRGLAWVAVKWAGTVRPRVICLENVEEFTTWGPLKDGVIVSSKRGHTFNSFINALRALGYKVEWRELRACDYGAPTIRKRLFIIARCDGFPIVWPAPTHGHPKKIKGTKLKPWRTAAECIDWSIPCPSIFERDRPLAENTLRRIAKGIKRFVIDAQEPFIIRTAHSDVGKNGSKRWGKGEHPCNEPLPTVTGSPDFAVIVPYLTEHANASNPRVFAAAEPLRTQCAQVKGGHFALVAPYLIGVGGPAYSGEPSDIAKPNGTVMVRNHKHLCTAFLAKHFGGVVGVEIDKPAPTILTKAAQTQIVTSHIMKMRGSNIGSRTDEPLHTISANGLHHAEVRAFLLKYYGNDKEPHDLIEPLGTVTTKDRFGLVTIHGEDYAIVDIGMRMLAPRELYRAQGFPEGYIIDRKADGSPLTKTAQVKMCGNSVCPPLSEAIVRANVPESVLMREIA